MSKSVANVPANLAALKTAFSGILVGANALAATEPKMLAAGYITAAEASVVDWATASTGWVAPIAAITARINALVALSNVVSFRAALSACLTVVLAATSEPVRTDPLWTLIANISNTQRTSTQALVSLQQNVSTSLTNWNAALTAANANTAGPVSAITSCLQTIVGAIPSAIQVLPFLDQYQDALAADVAGIMVWAAKDTAGLQADVPFVLKTFEYTNTTSYAADAAAMTAFTATNWAAIQSVQ
ncbi:hypothetical protein EUX98_g1357 [Antrodiella citrinella]|uniref:Uncharacterized protein n=1 Tax=Antrodiella citrinella TaxID=2447956 RepID=A0A4S4N1R9_9APHY|nr:hypothetical protein EUX98_g1357 [Antrodiella citrinella]